MRRTALPRLALFCLALVGSCAWADDVDAVSRRGPYAEQAVWSGGDSALLYDRFDGVLTAEMLGSGSDVEGKLKKLIARANAAKPAAAAGE